MWLSLTSRNYPLFTDSRWLNARNKRRKRRNVSRGGKKMWRNACRRGQLATEIAGWVTWLFSPFQDDPRVMCALGLCSHPHLMDDVGDPLEEVEVALLLDVHDGDEHHLKRDFSAASASKPCPLLLGIEPCLLEESAARLYSLSSSLQSFDRVSHVFFTFTWVMILSITICLILVLYGQMHL